MTQTNKILSAAVVLKALGRKDLKRICKIENKGDHKQATEQTNIIENFIDDLISKLKKHYDFD